MREKLCVLCRERESIDVMRHGEEDSTESSWSKRKEKFCLSPRFTLGLIWSDLKFTRKTRKRRKDRWRTCRRLLQKSCLQWVEWVSQSVLMWPHIKHIRSDQPPGNQMKSVKSVRETLFCLTEPETANTIKGKREREDAPIASGNLKSTTFWRIQLNISCKFYHPILFISALPDYIIQSGSIWISVWGWLLQESWQGFSSFNPI